MKFFIAALLLPLFAHAEITRIEFPDYDEYLTFKSTIGLRLEGDLLKYEALTGKKLKLSNRSTWNMVRSADYDTDTNEIKLITIQTEGEGSTADGPFSFDCFHSFKLTDDQWTLIETGDDKPLCEIVIG